MMLSRIIAFLCFSLIIGGFNSIPLYAFYFNLDPISASLISMGVVSPMIIVLAYIDKLTSKFEIDSQ